MLARHEGALILVLTKGAIMNRRTLVQTLGATLMLHPALTSLATAEDVTASTVYELRVYHMNPGKLPLILDRFRTKETAIFTRCGMHNVAFWTPTEDADNAETHGNTLVYMLRHASREAAKASWAKFKADPEWVVLQAETEKDGTFVNKIESTFLSLTDFSPKL